MNEERSYPRPRFRCIWQFVIVYQSDATKQHVV
jgi:hypothetical protein